MAVSSVHMLAACSHTLCQTRIPHSSTVFSNRDAQPVDLDAFAAHLAGSFIPNAVIIDATASEAPAEHYESWMRAGVNVITPNKKVCLLLPAVLSGMRFRTDAGLCLPPRLRTLPPGPSCDCRRRSCDCRCSCDCRMRAARWLATALVCSDVARAGGLQWLTLHCASPGSSVPSRSRRYARVFNLCHAAGRQWAPGEVPAAEDDAAGVLHALLLRGALPRRS